MNIYKTEKKYVVQTYKRCNLFLVKGKGMNVWDEAGKKYMDFFAGISVCNLGHCHTAVVKSIKEQVGKLMHVSNHYYTYPNIKLAEELIKRSFPGKVFFSNSGAEANECAIKLARKWGSSKKKYEIIAFDNSFHGRTLATLSATGQKKFHKGFEPMLPGFKFAEFNDILSVKKHINKKTVAVMIEPVQGEGGVVPAKTEFLKDLRKLCDKHGILLIFDEIQTGMGRTGKLFSFQGFGVKPDIFTLAKSLSGGLPFGATIAKESVACAFQYGDHGSTFGGNPVSSSAALAVIKLIDAKMLAYVRNTGEYFKTKLEALKSKYSFIKEVRGIGLMLGLELDFDGKDIVKSCQDKGLIINCTHGNVLRFLPPLIIAKKDIDTAISILDKVLLNCGDKNAKN